MKAIRTRNYKTLPNWDSGKNLKIMLYTKFKGRIVCIKEKQRHKCLNKIWSENKKRTGGGGGMGFLMKQVLTATEDIFTKRNNHSYQHQDPLRKAHYDPPNSKLGFSLVCLRGSDNIAYHHLCISVNTCNHKHHRQTRTHLLRLIIRW